YAPNLDPGDQFGTSLALTRDGATLVVGAPFEDSSAAAFGGFNSPANNSTRNAGAAYVFTRNGLTWSAAPVLPPLYIKSFNTGEEDHFGRRVAISADGIILVVSAPEEDSSARGVDGNLNDNASHDAGAVYIYVRDGDHFTPTSYLKASNTEPSV